jgi:hypothetical protein
MRLTWLVLGVVVAAGAVAFINTDEADPQHPAAKPDAKGPALNRAKGADAPAAANLELTEAQVEAENRARKLLKQIEVARAEGGKNLGRLVDQLKRTAWDTPSARRYAYLTGRRLLKEAGNTRSKTSIAKKDEARRLLSRVLYLPEMFTPRGQSTDERTKLIQTIQRINRQVMGHGPGVEGVTVPYEVEPGVVPVQIVSRQKLMMGANGILFWNQGGNLDPKRLRAGQTLLLPQEELTVHVFLRYRRMALFVGDWFVKEFRVGVGKEETPTPTGEFVVLGRQLNPDWTNPRTGKEIPYGDPRNELGDAWMAIENDEWPKSAGYGLHGTKDPKTVGTRCSNGCVRLVNPEAIELRDWVRTAKNGKATRVFIR